MNRRQSLAVLAAADNVNPLARHLAARNPGVTCLPASYGRGQMGEDFELSLRAMAGLAAHPNVAAVYDVGEVEGRAYIAMEIVEGATLLGFVKLTEGDVEITPAGLEYSNAPILRQKELFRNAALEHVALLKQIKRALESKSDHTLPDDFFHDILDEHFTEEETLRQLETAINWGRYAELFDHDAERKRFFIPEETPAEPQNVEVGTET